jgi:hypothetical protein
MKPLKDMGKGTLDERLRKGIAEVEQPPELHISPSPRIVTLDDIRDMGGIVEDHLVLKKGSYSQGLQRK